ncbi:unnamed protein product [Ascophyllum nodosum]
MLVEVGEHHYRFVRPNGRNVMYNLDSLVDYFISTGISWSPRPACLSPTTSSAPSMSRSRRLACRSRAFWRRSVIPAATRSKSFSRMRLSAWRGCCRSW